MYKINVRRNDALSRYEFDVMDCGMVDAFYVTDELMKDPLKVFTMVTKRIEMMVNYGDE